MTIFLFLVLLAAGIVAILVAGHFNHEERMDTTPAVLLAMLGIAATIGAAIVGLMHASEVDQDDAIGPLLAGIITLLVGSALGVWVIRTILGRHTAEIQIRSESLAAVMRSHNPNRNGGDHE